MEKLKRIIIVFKVLILLALPMGLSGQTFSEKEIVTRTYSVSPQTTIEVNNKYGKVHVIPWRKDSVKFEIELSISSNNLSRLNKTRNGIQFDFTSSKYYITAITDFGGTGSQIFTELRNLSDAIIPGKNSIEVNYKVFCPETVNLSIINKFGDIYIDDLRGEINISLSNGDMKINSISGEAQIELNFGNGIINHLSDAKLTASYSDVNIKAAEKLTAITKSSTLNIGEADLLQIESRRDKYFVDRAHTLKGSSNFSQIWLQKLLCNTNIGLKFGSLTIDNIPESLCDMDITTEYADLNLYLSEITTYQADIYHHKDVNLTLPDRGPRIGLSTIQRSDEEMHTFYKTADSSSLPKIKIQALEKCYVNLIIR